MGKRIVVAGSASGIGAATAKYLAAEGARILVGDMDAVGARATADAIRAAGGDAESMVFNLADEASISALIECAAANFGGLDGLANVAADVRVETLRKDTDLLGMDVALWERTLRTNLIGFALTIRASLPHFIAAGSGSIVNISSAAAWLGEDTRPAYASSKIGGHALTRHVARRWGANGIRCNAIAPGLVFTAASAKVIPAEQKESTLRKICLRRFGKPEDIAQAVAFLLSDSASWITGQIISVDGGFVLRE